MTKHATAVVTAEDAPARLQERAVAELQLLEDERKAERRLKKRLSALVYASIVGLLATGLLMSNRAPAYLGLFSFGNLYSTLLTVKHILVLLMIGVALYRSLVLGRKSGPPERWQKLNAGLLLLNIVLGIGVMLLSGLTASLAAGPAG